MSCKTHHPDWTHMFWDKIDGRRLIETCYPWFIPTFDGFKTRVLMSGSIRIFVLHAYGGIYLDMDTECIKPMDDVLSQYQAVFQNEVVFCNDAQVASRQAFPVWPMYFQYMMDMARKGITSPLLASGPGGISATLRAWLEKNGKIEKKGVLDMNYTVVENGREEKIRIFSPYQWYLPYFWNQAGCYRDLLLAGPGNRATELYGIHHFSGSWTVAPKSMRSHDLASDSGKGMVRYLGYGPAFKAAVCKKPILLRAAPKEEFVLCQEVLDIS
jgi:hypothetical protein